MLRSIVHSARSAHEYGSEERQGVRCNVREARRRWRNPQWAQRPGQFREGIRRVLCVRTRAVGVGKHG
jgi:hypothetical protein